MEDNRVSACFMIVAGISGYFYARKENARERLRVAETLGEVVKVETSRWKRFNNLEDGSPVSIRFLAQTGVRSTFTIMTNRKYEMGDQIPVIYEPQHPENAGVKSHRRFGPPWIWILIAIGGIAVLIFKPQS